MVKDGKAFAFGAQSRRMETTAIFFISHSSFALFGSVVGGDGGWLVANV